MAECPRPEKVRHASKAAALAAIKSLRAAGKGSPDWSAYLCACGSWHIGHSSWKLRARVRRTLSAADHRNGVPHRHRR